MEKKSNNVEYNYFYKITNTINGKFYYGVHKTPYINDNYMGSGVALSRAKKKYGIDNFTKEILKVFDTYNECLAYETSIVDKDMINNPMCYNMKTGGLNGCIHSEETKQRMKISHSKRSNENYKTIHKRLPNCHQYNYIGKYSTIEIKTCPVCTTLFTAKVNSKKVYCSAKCSYKAIKPRGKYENYDKRKLKVIEYIKSTYIVGKKIPQIRN